MKYVIDTANLKGWLRHAWKRVRCIVTLNHIDPGVMSVGQQLTACKRCGKVWKVWP